METLYEITKNLIPLFIIMLCTWGCVYYFQKQKIYRYPSDKWLNIKEYPIPEDIRGFIATDGKNVDYMYSVKWAPYGKLYFSHYENTYITHWMPLPDAPKNK